MIRGYWGRDMRRGGVFGEEMERDWNHDYWQIGSFLNYFKLCCYKYIFLSLWELEYSKKNVSLSKSIKKKPKETIKLKMSVRLYNHVMVEKDFKVEGYQQQRNVVQI